MRYNIQLVKLAIIGFYTLLTLSCGMKMDAIIPDLTKDEPDAKAYNLQGTEAVAAGRYEEAVAGFSKAIELDPTYAEAYYNRGFAYNKMGHYDKKSIADYTKAIELIPDFGDAYKKRAINFYEVGKCDEAWSDVRQAQGHGVQCHPGFLEALKKQCPRKAATPRKEMSSREAAQRLKSYWNAEPTEEHFGMSVVQGQKEAVALFLTAGLSVDSKHMGDPVLCHAITSFQYGIAQMLIVNGADVNLTDGRGNPPLVLAVGQCGIPELPKGATKGDLNQLVQSLVDGGADLSATFRGAHTVYQMAGIMKCKEIQETLRKAGAK